MVHLTKDKHGFSALHYVAPLHGGLTDKDYEVGSPINRLTRRILGYPGIDVNITDNLGNSPLHWAVWWGGAKCRWAISLLLIEETDTNPQNNYGETSLHYATRLGRSDCVVRLLNQTGINPNIKEHKLSKKLCGGIANWR